ncbi:MAG: radical SAM protein [Clostridia bacterium]|nr:radical SAM protein [Clostridia bacterium]
MAGKISKPTNKENRRVPFRLRSCVWEITLACSFSCKYCGSRAGKAAKNELSTAECLDVVRQLRELGLRRVNLIGGEVFMRKDWKLIVAAFCGAGIRVCIITNGYRLADEDLEFLRDARIESIAVSLDGPAEVHDAWRMKGSYDRAVESIKRVHEYGIPVSVITALRKDNAPLLQEFYDGTVKQLPIFAWQLQSCAPMGNAAGSDELVRYSFIDVIRWVAKTAPDAPFGIGIADNAGYFTPEEPYIRGGGVFAGCSAGITVLGIDCEGNVTGCESMRDPSFIEGNVRETPLADIWYSPDTFRYNRGFDASMLKGKCAGCPEGPYCAGGCRSYNFFTSGDLYESKYCARNSGEEETI